MQINQLTEKIIGAAIEVHKQLGPGLLESTYEVCLAKELQLCGIKVERQKGLPVVYKGIALDCGYRIDMLIDDSVIVELKVVDKVLPIHEAQLLAYLKLSGYKIGLLINFNEQILSHGIRRLAN